MAADYRMFANFCMLPTFPDNVPIPVDLGEILPNTLTYRSLLFSVPFLDIAAARKIPMIVSFVLQNRGFQEGVATALAGRVPNFPIHLLEHLYQTTTWGRGTVVLPNLAKNKGLAFLVNYPQVKASRAPGGLDTDGEEPEQIKFLPILCWCTSIALTRRPPAQGQPSSTTASLASPTERERVPVITLFSFDDVVPRTMAEFGTKSTDWTDCGCLNIGLSLISLQYFRSGPMSGLERDWSSAAAMLQCTQPPTQLSTWTPLV
ncbi:hypothetical protein B0H67DRAFT_300259 [Lasiosphaeris hirsuta]|uniref:Uncharacterized protein n=1 Tax=Lasiosphaeris hirsuta TaxID=260670 RepID=A0AA40A9I3_9PEZI|nr:hypothetical protein B0H67DRAFT_300259 [Lasiosphaeris hirsuta]